MEQLYNYIVVTLLAPENAMRQYNRIADAILRLDILPERFREIGSEFGRAENYEEWSWTIIQYSM